jgi:hypothetical protein
MYALLNPADDVSIVAISISVLAAALIYAALLWLIGEIAPSEKAGIKQTLSGIVHPLKALPDDQAADSRSTTHSSTV